MDRPRLTLWLRIAVTEACVVMFVGLIGLWVRSYARSDEIRTPLSANHQLEINSMRGRMMFSIHDYNSFASSIPHGLEWNAYKIDHGAGAWDDWEARIPTWGGMPDRVSPDFVVPHWFFLALSAALAFVPWLSWSTRFSLRTMLILTTLVAAGIGLIVWSVKSVKG
jgi:hypothetical protein